MLLHFSINGIIFEIGNTTKTIDMKNVMYTVAVVAVMLSVSSCRKCQICTKDSAPEIRVCEKDYNSATEYGAVIDSYEFIGYDCF